MKLFTGWVVSVGLIVAATSANAQVLAPYGIGGAAITVSDVGGPYSGGFYAGLPPEAQPPDYGPRLLPPLEVYTIVRESGFSPLGIPQQRGLVYTISVIDRGGDDGRLIIDARTGRIIRFMPAYRMGDNFNEDLTGAYGPVGPLPPISDVRRIPRPQASVPSVSSRVASRAPLPTAPRAASESRPLAAKPAPPRSQQSAAIQAKPIETPPLTAAPAPVEAKPAEPAIQPTQEMPKAQGLN